MSSAASSAPPRALWPLLALAAGAFGIGTTEFGPMGLLPQIAAGVSVSIPAAGMLVSAYALGVMIGAPLMTLALAHWPRRRALMLLMAIFTLGNALSALAPGYLPLLLARLVTSLNHGAFFGLGSLLAASLVPPNRQASAVAAMFLGLTIANIGGVPAAAWLGQTLGWRLSFAATAGLGLVAMLGLRLALPPGQAGARPRVRAELAVLRQPTVLLALATTVLSAGATFALYTYIVPLLEVLSGASAGFVTAMLVLIGLGFTLGNVLGGRLADRSLRQSLLVFLGLLMIMMLAFPWLAGTPLGAGLGLLVWGMAAFGVVPPLQMQVMRAASGAPGLASSVNVGAFNLGNALGAAAGGAVLSAGLGYAAVPVAGAGLALAALLLVLLGSPRRAAGHEQPAPLASQRVCQAE